MQSALLGLRHFNSWDLPVPPYLAIHRYRSSLLRHPLFPRLLFQNPGLMVAFHQSTRCGSGQRAAGGRAGSSGGAHVAWERVPVNCVCDLVMRNRGVVS